MHAYVGNLTNERCSLLQAIRTYYKPKEKGEGAADDEAMVSTFDLAFPGAWPLERIDGNYTRFGMPRLPVWLQFQPEFTPDMGSTFENWLGDIGGANGIPELVKTCLRSFLVQARRPPLFPPFYQKLTARRMRRTWPPHRSPYGAHGTTSCATSGRPTRPSCSASTTARRPTRSAPSSPQATCAAGGSASARTSTPSATAGSAPSTPPRASVATCSAPRTTTPAPSTVAPSAARESSRLSSSSKSRSSSRPASRTSRRPSVPPSSASPPT